MPVITSLMMKWYLKKYY